MVSYRIVSILTGLFFHIYQKEQIAVKIAAKCKRALNSVVLYIGLNQHSVKPSSNVEPVMRRT